MYDVQRFFMFLSPHPVGVTAKIEQEGLEVQ